jgi:hypothetical protein
MMAVQGLAMAANARTCSGVFLGDGALGSAPALKASTGYAQVARHPPSCGTHPWHE